MNTLLQINDSVAHLPAGAIAMLFAIAIGYLLKAVALFPNKYIPLAVLPLTAVLYAAIQFCADKLAAKEHAALYLLINFMIGFIYGFIAWLLHAQLLRRFLDPKVFNDDGSTKFFTNPKSPAANPPPATEPK